VAGDGAGAIKNREDWLSSYGLPYIFGNASDV
jgi:hypothetical protein